MQVTLSVFAIVYFQWDFECKRETDELDKFPLSYLKRISKEKQTIDNC